MRAWLLHETLWFWIPVVWWQPGKLSSCSPKWHLAIVGFNRDYWMQLDSALMFLTRCWGSFAAISMSATYSAHSCALVTGSRYSGMKLEIAKTDLLRPWFSLEYAKVRLVKLNASISTGRYSATYRQWYACEQSSLQKLFVPAMCWDASARVADGVVLVYVIVGDEVDDFSQVG